MSHLSHIATHKATLDLRWQILRAMREFFWSEGFQEVETPLILGLPGQEPYLSPMKLPVHNERGEAFTGFLHTSPEYAMKKMLAAGYTKIFSLGKVFRDHESFGGTHNPEFTMVEWYRANADFYALMDDVERLFGYITEKLKEIKEIKKLNFERVHMRDVWKEYVWINLDEYLTREAMFELCVQKGYAPKKDEPYEDLFYRIFLNEIEPKLADRGGIILHHYPPPMAALSRPSEKDLGYAERVEVYMNGLEIANGFSELTDPVEQKKRLTTEQAQRRAIGKDVFAIDEDFIEAVGHMPPSAGIALGVDRLVQYFGGCKNIDDVLPLPASELFAE